MVLSSLAGKDRQAGPPRLDIMLTEEILQSQENIGHTEYSVAPAGLLDTVAAATAPHPGVHTLASR